MAEHEEAPEPSAPRVPPPSGDPAGPTVVGLGASAGGLAALRTFFSQVPPHSGLAYVVVVHLAPEYPSHLAELLQPHVRMPVQQVAQTTRLEPDCVYVIPPNRNLSAIDTHLRLSELEGSRRARAPIDHFLRTLAATHDGNAVGVILTGTGSDGALGIKAIKEKGGLTVVQDPAEAEYDGMPRSAIATGLVDLVLPLERMPDAVLRFAHTEPRVSVADDEDLEREQRSLLQKVFAQLRARTGRDFVHYKRSTILRRIQRRMQMRQVEELPSYLELLRAEPEEVRALADDLLVTVTNFFRDREVFEALEHEVVPRLFQGKGADDTLRVWCVGCATGEEAYSLAMLLLEEAARHEVRPRLQVFASDLHERSLARAREALYPGDIEIDVSEARLRRFFHREEGGYRVRKEVRELIVFAPHNLLGDPPFSRLDLISCRNVLIYLQRDAQRDVLELFHYALNPAGFLVLGTSETLDGSGLFHVEHKSHCIYRRRSGPASEPRLPVFPSTGPTRPERAPAPGRPDPRRHGALHQRMVERYAPPSILVSPDDRVAHLSEHSGRYLVPPGGEATLDVFKLARQELKIELRAALHAVRECGEARRARPVAVRIEGKERMVVMDVRPALEPEEEGYALVIFSDYDPAEGALRPAPGAPGEEGGGGRDRELEAELDLTRQRLQAIIEERETGQEELRASNEELQSANEELRSTLEELETSKEELQSMNEELQTVNQENRHKVEEFAQLSSDLQNLLASTEIATLFLDRELRILRFTPRAAELFNVRRADRGRPLSDLTHRLEYDALGRDAVEVLRTLAPVEREVPDDQGRWYLASALPYRSAEDRIEGVVLTFVDITRRKEAEESVRRSEARKAFLLGLSDTLRPLSDPVAVQETASRLLGERLGADRVGYAEGDDVMVVARDWVRPGKPSVVGEYPVEEFGAFRVTPLREERASVIEDARKDPRVPPEVYRRTWEVLDARAAIAYPLVRQGRLVAALFVHQSEPRAWTDAEVDLVKEVAERTWAAVAQARAEEALRQSEAAYRTLFESIDEGFCVVEVLFDDDAEPVDYRFLEVNPSFEVQTGLRDAVGRRMRELAPEHEEHWFEIYGRVATTGEPERFTAEAHVLGRWYDVYAYRAGAPEEHRVAILFNDVTEREQAEAAVRELNESLERRVEERTAALQAEARERRRAEEARRKVLRQLVGAEENERRRISRELHDQLGQQMTAIVLGLRAAQQRADASEVAEPLRELERLAVETARDMQSMAVELRPPALDTLGLVAALQGHLEDWSARHHLEVDFQASGLAGVRLPPEIETTVYRVVQEALTNVLKHAGASSVSLVVERRDGTVRVVLEDDGRGFAVEEVLAQPEKARRLGLRGMRERVALLGGELAIESSPGIGTTLYVRVPERLDAPDDGA